MLSWGDHGLVKVAAATMAVVVEHDPGLGSGSGSELNSQHEHC